MLLPFFRHVIKAALIFIMGSIHPGVLLHNQESGLSLRKAQCESFLRKTKSLCYSNRLFHFRVMSKVQQYLCRLYYRSTNQLCLDMPILYFYHDGAGGWSRLENRLKVNDLKFGGGGKAPGSHLDIMTSINEHVEVCLAEGAVNVIPPEKPIGFKSLIKLMEVKGLLKPSSSPRVSAPPPALHGTICDEVQLSFPC